MKKLFILFFALCSISVYAQSDYKKSFVITATYGNSNMTGDLYYNTYIIKYQDIFKSNSYIAADIALRFGYKRLYAQIGGGFSIFDMEYDLSLGVIDDHTMTYDFKKHKAQSIAIPIIFGFNYINKTRFYPLIEAGYILNMVIGSSVNEAWEPDIKSLIGAITARVGAGIKITPKIAVELKGSYLYTGNNSSNRGSRHYNSLGGQVSFVFDY